MALYPQLIERLLEKLARLPGIGRRSAERIVDYILGASAEEIKFLSQAISAVKENIRHCKLCNNLSEADLCHICKDSRREKTLICIVENPGDVTAIEKASSYRGLYHVLLGAISPLDGRGPADLRIGNLISRMKQNSVREVIIATDADTEGEATALYLSQLIKPYNVKISRIGLGLPFGSNLEYADPTTLSKALESRREM
jgi:recombination protein RecR